MGFQAGDLVRFLWSHPIASVVVTALLFTPPLFPVVVFFSPLLISTALFVLAMISMGSDVDDNGSSGSQYKREWNEQRDFDYQYDDEDGPLLNDDEDRRLHKRHKGLETFECVESVQDSDVIVPKKVVADPKSKSQPQEVSASAQANVGAVSQEPKPPLWSREIAEEDIPDGESSSKESENGGHEARVKLAGPHSTGGDAGKAMEGSEKRLAGKDSEDGGAEGGSRERKLEMPSSTASTRDDGGDHHRTPSVAVTLSAKLNVPLEDMISLLNGDEQPSPSPSPEKQEPRETIKADDKLHKNHGKSK